MEIQHNFNKADRGIGTGWDYRVKNQKPMSIIVHTTNGNYGSTFGGECRYLYNSNSVGAHYIISKHGHIEELLAPELRAWHAGATIDGYNNNQSIGIECHYTPNPSARGDKYEVWTQAMREALTWLVRRLMTQYAIPASRIETHRAVAIPRGRKIDPSGWTDTDFYAWRDTLAVAEPPPDVQVIGVAQRATKAQIIGSCQRNRIALTLDEIERFYTFCEWLNVRADFVLAIIKHETDFGRAGVALVAHNNVAAVKTSADDWRDTAAYNSAYWMTYESVQLALYDLVGRILKNHYGRRGLHSVRSIITSYAPPFENQTERYIASVLEDMDYIVSH